MLRQQKFSLQFSALKRGFPETLTEKVLGSITSSVASITRNRNYHLLIFFILGKDFLEAIRHVEKVIRSADFTLKKFWLYFEPLDMRAHFLLKTSQTIHTYAH